MTLRYEGIGKRLCLEGGIVGRTYLPTYSVSYLLTYLLIGLQVSKYSILVSESSDAFTFRVLDIFSAI